VADLELDAPILHHAPIAGVLHRHLGVLRIRCPPERRPDLGRALRRQQVEIHDPETLARFVPIRNMP
jgi:hypothetical protein